MATASTFEAIRIRDFAFFDRLAALGSITAAARELGVPKATASRWLAQLERHVGQTLVRRTTRQLALTDEGEAFRVHAREILAVVRAAEASSARGRLGGTIRVSVPVPFGRLVGGSVIAGFRRALPGVRLEVALQNHRVDLVRDGFDVAIRGGALPDSDLIARKLATVPMWLYASAAYEAAALQTLPIIAAPGDEVWLRKRPALGRPQVVVDDRSAVAEALVFGAGAGILPAFLGEPARQRGELVRRDDAPLTSIPVHALQLRAQRDDPRVKVLIATIERELAAALR